MIYAQATATRLAWARIAIYGICIADLVTDPFPELAVLPQAWFSPHGPWVLIPDGLVRALWNGPALLGLKLLTLTALGLATLGLPKPRVWAAAAAFALTLTLGFVRGFGHADHSQLQLLLMTYALVFLPAWDALCFRVNHPQLAKAEVSIHEDTRGRAHQVTPYASAFAALALAFAFPYFLPGVHRLTHEGVGIFFGRSIQHFIVRDTLMLDHFEHTWGLALLDARLLPWLNLGFATVTLAEIGAPWAHLRARWTVVWLLLIVPFHLLSPVLMHVLFVHNLALLAVLYVWPLCWSSLRPAHSGARACDAREKYSTSPSDFSS